MDTKLGGLPLSAAPQGRTPSKVSLSSSAGSSSFLIRAPPTVDSDVESSNGQEDFNYTSSNYDSDTGFESEGFLSGEDGFETASERPFVADPDNESLQEGNVVEGSVVSRPNFTDPYGEFGEKSVLGDESAVSRPSAPDPYGRVGENSVFDEKSAVSRPIVSVPLESTLMTPTDEEGEYGSSSEVEIVDVGAPAIRAVVSRDSDDDFEGIEEVEEDELTGAARAGVEASGVEDEDEDGEQEFESLVEDNTTLVKDSVDDAADKLIEEEVIGDSEDSKVEFFLASDEGVIPGNSEINSELVYSIEEVPRPETMEQGESKQIEQQPLAEEVSDTDIKELEGSVVVKHNVVDSFSDLLINDKGVDEGPGFDSSMGSKDGVFSGTVETSEEFAYSVGEIQRLEIMEQQESEAKDGPSECTTEGTVLEETKPTFDGKEDSAMASEITGAEVLTGGNEPAGLGSDVSGHTPESKLLEESVFPSATIEATANALGLDVTEVGNDVHFDKDCAKDDQICENKDVRDSDDEVLEGISGTLQPVVLDPKTDNEVHDEGEDEVGDGLSRHSESIFFSDDDSKSSIFGNSDTAKVVVDDLEHSSLSSFGESSEKLSRTAQRRIIGDSDEEEAEVKELFGSDVLTALLKAASAAGSSRGNSSEFLSHFTSSGLTGSGASEENLSEEEKKRLEKLQRIRVKFLRLIRRLGRSPEDSVAAQVLYRLVLAAGTSTAQLFDLESAKRTALQLEVQNKDDLDFSLNILVLGKTGVGKSATVNSIFGEKRAKIDAFEPATASVKVIAGAIDGVKVKIFDTPGLRSSQTEQAFNRKVLLSVKKLSRKCPPDIVLYVDRLDTQTRDLDSPLLRSITSFLGSSIWSNAVVTLTHAASSPPDGPSGSPLSHDLLVAQRSRIIQQVISQSMGDLRMLNPSVMTPVSLIENHPEKGEDGDSWRSELLLLCYSMKILSEATSLERTRDVFDHKKLFGFRSRSAPLLYFLSSLLQPNNHPKLPADQGGDVIDSDNDLGDLSDSDLDDEDEDEYDQLPPFKPLKRSQIEKLSKEQRTAYFEEYDYRVRLLQKKQIKEELKSSRELKKGVNMEEEEESDTPATVAVPLPDMSLPPSFDADNPSHRYRFLEPTSQISARPVLDAQGWDHDCGYDGVSVETSLAVAGSFPAAAVVQITKDKKDFSVHLDSSVSAKHGEGGSRSTMAGLGVQAVGNQLAYVVKGETKMKTHKTNRAACGASVTFLGRSVATGVKVEDRIGLGRRVVLSGSTGMVRCEGDNAYGANFEVRVREKEFPVGQDETTVGMSLMRWRGDLIWGGNLQSQVSVGRSSKVVVRAGLNSKLSGQVSVRTSSSDQLQIALLGILPIANSIFKSFFTGSSGMYQSQ